MPVIEPSTNTYNSFSHYNIGSIYKREIIINEEEPAFLLFIDDKVGSLCKFKDGKLIYQYFSDGTEQIFDENGKSEIRKASPKTRKKYNWAFDKLINYDKLPEGKIEWRDYDGLKPDTSKPLFVGKQDESGKIREEYITGDIVGYGTRRKWVQKCRFLNGKYLYTPNAMNPIPISQYDRRRRANNRNIVYYQHKHTHVEIEVSPAGLILLDRYTHREGQHVVNNAQKPKNILEDGTVEFENGSRSTPIENGLKIVTSDGKTINYDMVNTLATMYKNKRFSWQQTEEGFVVDYKDSHVNYVNGLCTTFSVHALYDKEGKLSSLSGEADRNTGFVFQEKYIKPEAIKDDTHPYIHNRYTFEYNVQDQILNRTLVERYAEHPEILVEPKPSDLGQYQCLSSNYAKLEHLSIRALVGLTDLPRIRSGKYTFEYEGDPFENKPVRCYKDGKPYYGTFPKEDGTIVTYNEGKREIDPQLNDAICSILDALKHRQK